MAEDPRVSWFTDLLNVPARVKEILTIMADQSAVLNDIANRMRGPLATSIQALIAENVTLRQDNATLSGEDVAESEATGQVVSAFNEVSGLFSSPEVPADLPALNEDGSLQS